MRKESEAVTMRDSMQEISQKAVDQSKAVNQKWHPDKGFLCYRSLSFLSRLCREGRNGQATPYRKHFQYNKP